jgi:hypothetical protein
MHLSLPDHVIASVIVPPHINLISGLKGGKTLRHISHGYDTTFVRRKRAASRMPIYIPEMTVGWFNLLIFGWMDRLMTFGYARPLEASSDLWKLQDHRSAGVFVETILTSLDGRRKKAGEYSARLATVMTKSHRL